MRAPRDLNADVSAGGRRRIRRKSDSARPIRAKPRYSEVADQLRLAIMTGKYPVGTLLPSENELCQEFEISRHTVREAIRTLQLRGLVSRRQGQGTQVESDHRVSRTARLLGSIEDVERHGRDTHLVDIHSRVIRADAEIAAMLPCATNETLLLIESYREPRDPNTPWPRAWNETYLREPYSGIRPDIEGWPGAIYSLVERRYGERVTSIRQEVVAINLTADVARRLKVKTGTAGLQVKRTYFGRSGTALLFGFNTYVGEQYQLVMEIKAHD